jgi:sulfate permease
MSDLVAYATGALSLALALNIGANNSAAEMGPAYGAGVRSRRQALVLIFVFCTAGAIVAGGRVLHTVGRGLIAEGTLSANHAGALVVILSALVLIALANGLRLPISTAHAVIGAMVGLGLFYHSANAPLVIRVVAWWVVTPLAALVFSYLLGLSLYPYLTRRVAAVRSQRAVNWVIALSATLSGCWIAFSAGSNSLAKALGPAVAAGVFSPQSGAVVGGFGMAVGAVLLGGRMMKTVGKEITTMSPLGAVLIELISASIVFTASRFGMPVSLAEIVTCSVIGFGAAANGVRDTTDNHHVRRIALLWPAAPVAAGAIAFGLQFVLR